MASLVLRIASITSSSLMPGKRVLFLETSCRIFARCFLAFLVLGLTIVLTIEDYIMRGKGRSNRTFLLSSPCCEAFPAALLRGGDFVNGTSAGVFAVGGSNTPLEADSDIGFRAAR